MLNWNLTVSRFYRPTLLAISLLLCQPAHATDLESSVSEAEFMRQQGASSQAIILASQSTTQKLLIEFKSLNEELDQLKINQAHLDETHHQQIFSMQSLQQQLNTVANTEKAIIPHLLSMIDWLDNFITQDIPFHLEERQQRITYLKTSIVDPSISLPERYRRVLEAYQIESEYGYTIEAYPQTIKPNASTLHVQLLRVGRIGLYYQSEDEQHNGYWNDDEKIWQTASSDTAIEISDEIKNGLLIAQKQRPHSLLSLPVIK